ncbi:MAG: S-methyl-5-thioribose-1-phosphate isomerase [Roseiflexus sp.]|nr:S-methyl-5-thioribose-1-phosphate isomerase [Roseiflexus sp.]MDW8145795.1 S-methyl-5-thioribose-1-phosphate isomerase [Roseiflexaceae bacterium]
MNSAFRTVWWEAGQVCLIDQRLLPDEAIVVRCTTVEEVAHAIRTMQIRGAPAIGCAAAYGMALAAHRAAREATDGDQQRMYDHLTAAKMILDSQRPTAVNLSWATKRVLEAARRLINPSPEAIAHTVLEEAHAILAEDLAMCHAIGRHGVTLIPPRGHVLTHCNAGGLATAGYGTALAPIRKAHEQGRPIHVYVDETRPFLQGARLTAWELQQERIPLTLITDNMAGYFMKRGEIDCVIVGADRIVANGDVANKIGTYSLAVLAHAHGIPFYVAAPSSTIDISLPNGDAIPIEERSPDEVTTCFGRRIAPEGVTAAHPAFDVTPSRLVTALITERGVIYPPFGDQLRQLVVGS